MAGYQDMDRWFFARVLLLTLAVVAQADEAMRSSDLKSMDTVSDMVAARSASAAVDADGLPGSLWVRRPPKDAALHARRKELVRRYWQAGAHPQFVDRMVGGDIVGALEQLRKQALAGDPAAINLYADFVYWNCWSGRTTDQLDGYTASQMRESLTLPAADAEWFRTAFLQDIAFDKAVGTACRASVDVGHAFDLVGGLAKHGDSESLWLESETSSQIAEKQSLERAAAIAGSAQAQFEIAFTVLAGYQRELLGTGPDALDLGELLRESAPQIPQAEGNLATCLFYGCEGIAADPAAGVRTALTAAEHGFFEALLNIAPHLTPNQLDPIDVDAWKLIHASVEMQCGQSWSNVKAMRATLDALSALPRRSAAQRRAEQLWAQYGAGLGC